MVCEVLDSRFVNNHIMISFQVLSPTNMPLRQVHLINWGVVDLKFLCIQYGVKWKLNGRKILPLISTTTIKNVFFH